MWKCDSVGYFSIAGGGGKKCVCGFVPWYAWHTSKEAELCFTGNAGSRWAVLLEQSPNYSSGEKKKPDMRMKKK